MQPSHAERSPAPAAAPTRERGATVQLSPATTSGALGGLQDAANRSDRVQGLGQLQALANAPVQRAEDDAVPDLSETSLDHAASEQSEAVGGARLAFRTAVGSRALASGRLAPPKKGWLSFLFSPETPDQRAEVGQFDAVAHKVIDEALPELLGGMHFENALAAISFAHDIFIKLLTEHPDLFQSAQLENELRQHLQAVIARLPVADDGEEDEEDDDDDDEERREPKTMGKTDKRYLAALVRV
ncbi:MAG TPA: hypothetical protein VFF16_04670, partial [Telluria sp.]|nr:hypothetical protein [Telluria sp.]